MSDYPDDISIMEELDPEPEPQGRSYAREFVLGALLLLVVVTWAGWQSWQQEMHRASYREAEQAVSAQDWDIAYDRFRAAADYRDAPGRAQQIASLITDRDKHYRAATTAISDKRWAAALKELQAVRSLQPRYWDVASLYDRVEGEVYSNALGGAIALRTGAEPPGLYYRADSGWVWLDGSDRWSHVLSASDDAAVYDVPGEGWQPGLPTPTPVPANRQPPSGRPELQGRRLKVATLNGSGVTVRDSTLDPAFYTTYFPAGDRIIAGRYNERVGTFIHAVRTGYNGWWLDYEYPEQGRPVSATLSLGSADETVLDFSLRNDLYLVAVSSGISIRSSEIELFLGMKGEDGSQTRRPIYSHVGQLGGGQISQDGRYALLTTITPTNNPVVETQSALLFDLIAQTPPYTLTTHMVPVDTVGSYVSFDTWVKGAFLHEGEYAGQVLLVEGNGREVTVSLIDPAKPETRTTVVQTTGTTNIFAVAEKPGSSEVWLAGQAIQDNTPLEPRKSARMLFIRLTPTGEPGQISVPQSDIGFMQSFGSYGGYLLYAQEDSGNIGMGVSVSTVPNSLLERGQEVAPTEVYSGTIMFPTGIRSTGYSSQDASWYPGQGLLAYTENGSLYVRDYDGSNEVKLEPSVVQVIDPRFYMNTQYLR